MSDLKIENVTLIDGQRADDYSSDSILKLIEKEQKALDRLRDIQSSLEVADSKKLQKMEAKHHANIKALIKALDATG